MAEQYATRERSATAERTGWMANDSPYDGYVRSLAAPMDRVRWSSVLAGLFTVLATLIVLTVLGIAIGLSTFDANNPNSFGIGAGIYGAITALIAFFFGGLIAARTSAVAGSGNGILNGAMVWIVTIPLIVNILGTGIGSLLGTAANVAGTAVGAAAEVAGPAVAEVASNPALQATVVEAGQDAAGAVVQPTVAGAESAVTTPNAVDPAIATPAPGIEGAVQGAQGTVQDIQEQVDDITPQDVENVARDLSGPAWTALLALGLSAGAAIIGGYLGRRTHPTDIAVNESVPARAR